MLSVDPVSPVPAPFELVEWWDVLNAVAQTVGAIGTAGALLIAALSYRRQVLERRRDLASRVGYRVTLENGVAHLRIENRGELPISDVQFVEPVSDQEAPHWGILERLLAGTTEAGRDVFIPVVGPDGRSSGRVGDVSPGASVEAFVADAGDLGVKELVTFIGVKFTDGRGRQWVRSWHGALYLSRTLHRRNGYWADRFASAARRLLPGRVRDEWGNVEMQTAEVRVARYRRFMQDRYGKLES